MEVVVLVVGVLIVHAFLFNIYLTVSARKNQNMRVAGLKTNISQRVADIQANFNMTVSFYS